MGGFFMNLRGEYDLGTANTRIQGGSINRVEWNRFVIGISAGYKLGIMNRIKPTISADM
jgi:hypothetical protein